MSAATKQALDDALAAHIADDSDGAIVTSYILFASTQTVEMLDRQSTGYFSEYGDGQPLHVCIGLATMILRDLTASADEDD